MKNVFRLLGIIALIAVIGFSLVSCIGGGGGGKKINSADELKAYLNKQPANSPDNPIKIKMSVNEQMIKDVAGAIALSGKYVSLDLSGSPLTSIPKQAFNYFRDIGIGCNTLVSITIPKSVTSIGYYALANCTNLTSVTFEGTIPLDEMWNGNAFGRSDDYHYIGDLCDKYLKGGPGTYTRPNGESETWTKVGGGNAKTQSEEESGSTIDSDYWWAAYLMSTYNLKTFKARLDEIERDGTIDRYHEIKKEDNSTVVYIDVWGTYLGSTHNLKTFKDRLNEIEKDSTVDKNYYWLTYLSSMHNFKTFKDRLSEIQNDGTVDKNYWGAYLVSTHNLKTFKKRLKDIGL